jgi:hypothetical protein
MFKAKRSRKNATRRRKTAVRTTPTNKKSFLDLWAWFLPADMFAKIAVHGNTKWNPIQLIILAFCWTWSDARGLTDAFVEAAERARSLFGGAALSTYQGFMRALVRWSPMLVGTLTAVVRQRMEEIGSRFWRIGGWVPIAFDGSRSTAPRTKSNEAAYCAANYGRGKTARYRRKKTKGMRRRKNERNKAQPQEPQAWLTLMWHVGLRLPWAWRIGPSNASERDHAMEMVQGEAFPKRTLFCGDAGFIGYPLWARIREQGHDFLIRAGANVYLLVETLDGRTIRDGQEQIVLCWPQEAQRAGQPPLRLRLIHTRIRKTKVWLLTSVLDRKQLTLRQAVRLYELRWGIEVEFRGLKQTLNRAELRCRNADRLRVELDWSILGMAVAELLALKEQLSDKSARPKKDRPAKRSLAEAMRALRWCLRNLDQEMTMGPILTDRLRQAVVDNYKRRSSKRARYRPPNPDKKPLGDPKLRVLTSREATKLLEMEMNLAA